MMGRILVTKDNQNHLFFNEQDLFRLVEEYMGSDFSELLADKFQETQDDLDAYDDEVKELKVDHKEMVKSIESALKQISHELEKKKIDLSEIEEAMDEISDAIHDDPWKWECGGNDAL
ncbi:hypothetical protein [Lactimicrobium massiliense]|uniref:hypothetical protein n=1 Tax=Lactimicrobium massiliense TaxID=2161814 RepID=UPI00107EF7B9|nr:hypothetical protein [Lactimicrobium massiliense]